MESNTTTMLSPSLPSSETLKHQKSTFNFELMQKEAEIPKQFIWSSKDLAKSSSEKLDTPLIDLKAVKSDEVAMAKAAQLVRDACMKHGFFEVTNHGVDPSLIADTYEQFQSFFKLPLDEKLKAKKKVWGYSCAHAERFSTSLPWKEIFTYRYNYIHKSDSQVVDFFRSILGEDFLSLGLVNQKYCDAMKEVSMVILELLSISLGADRWHFQRYFEDCEGIMRSNVYPSCQNSSMTLGVGPHCDPTSLTILHQDQIGGLEVYVNDKWLPVPPRPETPDAFVINIGDTFTALSNGLYKSCLHRVLVNEKVARKSLTFFLNPKGDKTVKPPENLFSCEEERKFPDFTWSDLYGFTQRRHRADADTLPEFVSWIRGSSNTSNVNHVWKFNTDDVFNFN